MDENKMPWDTPSKITVATGETPIAVDTPRGTESSTGDKYGVGKPYRIFIVGDIKK